jgi:hypothetical protein
MAQHTVAMFLLLLCNPQEREINEGKLTEKYTYN